MRWLRVFSVFLIAAGARASTTFPGGNINTDTTWTLAGSPWIIQGDTTVKPNVTLTIEAGATVPVRGARPSIRASCSGSSRGCGRTVPKRSGSGPRKPLRITC